MSTSQPSSYELLGLSPHRVYTDAEIHKAYRIAALRAHPDKPGGSTEALRAVTRAKESLLASTAPRVDDVMDEYFGWSRENKDSPEAPPRAHEEPSGPDVAAEEPYVDKYMTFEVTLEELFAGVTLDVDYDVIRGDGIEEKSLSIPVTAAAWQRNVTFSAAGDAPTGYTPGDLHVGINIKPHDRFELRPGGDLVIRLMVSLREALCGIRRYVTHPSGEVLLVEHKKLLRGSGEVTIAGRGVAGGNLIVAFTIAWPHDLTDRQRAALLKAF